MVRTRAFAPFDEEVFLPTRAPLGSEGLEAGQRGYEGVAPGAIDFGQLWQGLLGQPEPPRRPLRPGLYPGAPRLTPEAWQEQEVASGVPALDQFARARPQPAPVRDGPAYRAPDVEEADALTELPYGTSVEFLPGGRVRVTPPGTTVEPAPAAVRGGGWTPPPPSPRRAAWSPEESAAYAAVFGLDPTPGSEEDDGWLDSLRGGLRAGEQWASDLLGSPSRLVDEPGDGDSERPVEAAAARHVVPPSSARDLFLPVVRARDGQSLSGQSARTRADFLAAAGGDPERAARLWTAEHEQELVGPRPSGTPGRSAPAASGADRFLPAREDVAAVDSYLEGIGARRTPRNRAAVLAAMQRDRRTRALETREETRYQEKLRREDAATTRAEALLEQQRQDRLEQEQKQQRDIEKLLEQALAAAGGSL